MDDFEELKTLAEEVTANVVKRARELEWKVELDDVSELFWSQDKILMVQELLVIDKQRNFFSLDWVYSWRCYEDCQNDNNRF